MRILSVMICGLVLACRSEPADPTISHNVIPVNQGFTLAVGETVVIGGADITIKFNRVTEDSRCPTDVVCVWAGNGQIELVARHENRNIVFGLNTGQGAREFDVSSWRIRLAELSPAPLSTRPIPANTYRAQLIVTKPG